MIEQELGSYKRLERGIHFNFSGHTRVHSEHEEQRLEVDGRPIARYLRDQLRNMSFKLCEVHNLAANKVGPQERPTRFPSGAIACEDTVAEEGLQRLLSSRRQFKILELRCENCFDILRLTGIDDFLAQKKLAESVCSYTLISLLGNGPKPSLFRQSDILPEEIQAEDWVLVRVLGIGFTPILFDDSGMTLIGDETVDETVQNVDATKDDDRNDCRRSLPERGLKARHVGNANNKDSIF